MAWPRTKYKREKGLNIGIARRWKHETNAKLVLDILPVPFEHRKVISDDRTASVTQCVL